MLADFHVHTVFCDGKNTPEEIVEEAINREFSAIGFSGHGFTGFDQRYCMKDMDGYIAEIRRLQIKYAGRLQIALGVEEDAFELVDRGRFDYIIGSAHYLHVMDRYYSVDSGLDYIQKGLELFGNDPVRLAEEYYGAFCDYIESRKPDIIGHFDLITKYQESGCEHFLNNKAYCQAAQAYITRAARSNCLFEVNAGAVARGLRTAPYPSEELLYTLKRLGGRLILSSDSHSADKLGFRFEEMTDLLRDVGFRQLYTYRDHTFVPYDI